MIPIYLRGAANHGKGSAAGNGGRIQRGGGTKYHGGALGGGGGAGARRGALLSGPRGGGGGGGGGGALRLGTSRFPILTWTTDNGCARTVLVVPSNQRSTATGPISGQPLWVQSAVNR